MRRIIQFMHPGAEATIRSDGSKAWNEGQHCRAFLRASQAETADLAGKVTKHDEVVLWGEWEAEAMRTAALKNAGARERLPENILTPIAGPPPPSARSPQNTDPFVFGTTFLYCCCKQVRTSGAPTMLRDLDRGSLVLFGSQVDGHFVLDTVFVVADGENYDAARGPAFFRRRVAAAFVNVTLLPLAWPAEAHDDPGTDWSEEDELQACGARRAAAPGSEFRLYRGATPEKPVDGVFSFSPCMPATHPPRGFARPEITDDFVNPALSMGFRSYRRQEATGSEVMDTWRNVAEQVLSKGLLLGTRFEIPAE